MPPPPPPADLTANPLYKAYAFGQEPNIIDIGIQPLWLPPGLITEVLRRDRILRQSLTKEGLEIRFHSFLKGADVNAYLGQGKLDVGIGGDMPALMAVSRHQARVVAMLQQGNCSIVARQHMLLNDLRGKRIGIAYGSNAHYALIAALRDGNIPLLEIVPVYMNVTEMPDALARDELDAFAAWEPTPTMAQQKNREHVVVHRSLSTGYLYFSSSFYRDQPKAGRLIAAALIRSFRWLRADTKHLRIAARWTMAAGRALSGKAPELSEEEYIRLARNDLLGHDALGTIPADDLTGQGRLAKEFLFLKRLGKVPAAARWDAAVSNFDQSLILQTLAAAEQLQIHLTDYDRN